jgi:hypothetical protein
MALIESKKQRFPSQRLSKLTFHQEAENETG